jgi:hypothetical protein
MQRNADHWNDGMLEFWRDWNTYSLFTALGVAAIHRSIIRVI